MSSRMRSVYRPDASAASSSSICSARIANRCDTNGNRTSVAVSPFASTVMTPPRSGRVAWPSSVMPAAPNTGASASREYWLSWLPPMATTRAPVARSASSASQHDLLRFRRRRGRFEEVAGDEHEVDGFRGGDAGDLREHRAVLVQPGSAAQRLADVPVRGVEDPHVPGRPA